MRFVKGNVPKEYSPLYAEEFEKRVLQTFEENEILRLVELHEVPKKLLHGRMYFADGADWDPGSGRGCYLYDAAGPTWRFLG